MVQRKCMKVKTERECRKKRVYGSGWVIMRSKKTRYKWKYQVYGREKDRVMKIENGWEENEWKWKLKENRRDKNELMEIDGSENVQEKRKEMKVQS